MTDHSNIITAGMNPNGCAHCGSDSILTGGDILLSDSQQRFEYTAVVSGIADILNQSHRRGVETHKHTGNTVARRIFDSGGQSISDGGVLPNPQH